MISEKMTVNDLGEILKKHVGRTFFSVDGGKPMILVEISSGSGGRGCFIEFKSVKKRMKVPDLYDPPGQTTED